MRILLIAGGWSDEREVSLAGAEVIRAGLEKLGHQVALFDLSRDFGRLADEARRHDFAFLNLHGAPGEDGLPQAALDALGLPYQGSGPGGSMLALHKALAKSLFVKAGLPTPEWAFLPRPVSGPAESLAAPVCDFDGPTFVKPVTGGSSLGMRRCDSAKEVTGAVSTLWSEGRDALVERLIPGVELTCGVIGAPGQERALPPILIRPKMNATGFFDYQSKYDDGGAEEICPAPVPQALSDEVCRMALEAHRLLGLSGYSRADFLHDGETTWLLEVNTLPGMTRNSLLPKAAAAAGMSFEDLLAELIDLGMRERGRK